MKRDLPVPPPISDSDLRDFAMIWKAVFDEELPLAQARPIATDLLALYMLLATPFADRRPGTEIIRDASTDGI